MNNHSNQGQNNVLVNPPLVDLEGPILAQTSQPTPSTVGSIPNSGPTVPWWGRRIQVSDNDIEKPGNDAEICADYMDFGGIDNRDDATNLYGTSPPGFKKRRLSFLPDFRAVGRARNESAKDYSLNTKRKARCDTEDDSSPSIDEVSLQGDYSDSTASMTSRHCSPLPLQPAHSSSSLHLDRQVRPGSDSTSVGGNMTTAPLKLLQNAEPLQPAMLLPYRRVYPWGYSSSSAGIQTSHKTEERRLGRPRERDGGSRRHIRQEDQIETDLVVALRSLQVQPNFREIVSTKNKWGQTLAHLSIFYDYPSLLRSLIDWRIDLTIADANGLTALHYAYMKGDLNSIRTLRRGGGSEIVMDNLGRTPLDLLPEGSGSVFDLDNDTKVTSGSTQEYTL